MNKKSHTLFFIGIALLAFLFLLLVREAMEVGERSLARALILGFVLCFIWMLMQVMEVYTPKTKKKLKRPKICSYEQFYRLYYN